MQFFETPLYAVTVLGAGAGWREDRKSPCSYEINTRKENPHFPLLLLSSVLIEDKGNFFCYKTYMRTMSLSFSLSVISESPV